MLQAHMQLKEEALLAISRVPSTLCVNFRVENVLFSPG